MLSFRRTCPFGLPDDADTIDHIVLCSVGHTLRAATAHIAEEPLPAALADLLARLAHHERAARLRPEHALPPRRSPQHQPAGLSAGGPAAVEMQVAV